MTKYFESSEIEKIKKQRNRVMAVFYAALAVYIASLVVFTVMIYILPFGESKAVYKITEYTITAVFVIFSFLYLGIPARRVGKYLKFINNLETGIKETSAATFLEYDETLHEKDGVDCKSLIFLEWNKYKKEYYERKVLVFYEKDFPEIPENAEVKFITQGNFLIEYETEKDGLNAEKGDI